MPKHFNVFRQLVLGYILFLGLCVGLVTPIAQAEAPVDTLYHESSEVPETRLVDGLTQSERAQKIDTFFMNRKSPLAGYGLAMVQAADYYDIDWRLAPAIATIESNAGKMMCKNAKGAYNPFGYGSCKIGFTDFNQAIETLAKNLGGHNPKTEKFYKDKSVEEIIDTYNPPSIRHDYKKLVTWAMDKIASTEIPSSESDSELAMVSVGGDQSK
jgi:hypothetical protein